jgi:hypothetical protein
MTLETVLVSIGWLGGAGLLVCLYLHAARKARKTGERPVVLFLRCLAVFSLFHGAGLSLVTAVVLFATPALVAQLPATDHAWMLWMVGAGCVFLAAGGLVLCWTGWFPAARRA